MPIQKLADGVAAYFVQALEIMCRVDTPVVDKSGTLTEDKPRPLGIVPAAGHR